MQRSTSDSCKQCTLHRRGSPVTAVRETYSASHVEGNDGDTDILGSFPVDIGQLQPGMILLLPCSKRLPCHKGRT